MGRTIQLKSKQCPVQHKAMYPTFELASRAMMRVWGRDPSISMTDFHTYLCPHCSTYHFGHPSYYAEELKKNGQANAEA